MHVALLQHIGGRTLYDDDIDQFARDTGISRDEAFDTLGVFAKLGVVTVMDDGVPQYTLAQPLDKIVL